MKKVILLISAITLFSCSKDDNNQPEPNIYGKWYHKEIVINNIIFPYDDHEPCGKDYLEFYDENKIRSIDVWACEEDIDWIGTFSKTGSNLTISNGTESRTVEIIELTANSLVYTYAFDQGNDGIVENFIEKFDR